MRVQGIVQEKLVIELKKDYNSRNNKAAYERMKISRRTGEKVTDVILPQKKIDEINHLRETVKYTPLKDIISKINEKTVKIYWNDGTQEELEPNEIQFHPEFNFRFLPEKSKLLFELIKDAIKEIYLDITSKSIKTYQNIIITLKHFFIVMRISDIKQFEDRQIMVDYLKQLKKPTLRSTGKVGTRGNSGIHQKFNMLSGMINNFIEHHYDIQGFRFSINYPKILAKGLKNNVVNKHYIDRDKDEIELWINTQTSIRDKALWMLYALGLRNHEARMHKCSDSVPGSIKYQPKYKSHFSTSKYTKPVSFQGLKIDQIDWEKKCLINVKRKGKGSRSFQDFICLDDKTLITLRKWLDYRKKFHPEIENDLVLSRFVFPFRSSSFLIETSRKHFEYLKNLLESLKQRHNRRIENKKPISQVMIKEIQLIEKIIKKGYFKPHELRHSWDYLAIKNNMRDYLRRLHLNHSLKGMDETYVKPHITYEVYRKEFDRSAPKFNFIV